MTFNADLAPSLYETDFYAWSQSQARRLRALRADARELPVDLDLETIAEEIEDLGKAELHAAESFIRNILVHLVKALSDPNSAALPHWRTEVTTFHVDLLRRYTASMRRLIDMEKEWKAALRIARDALRENGRQLNPALPPTCPLELSNLVSEDFDFDAGLTKVRHRSPSV